MARRTRDWNKGLANDFKDTTFVRAFINAALDEGIPIQQVLRKLVDVVGLKETSKKTKMPSPNIVRVLNPKHNPTLETLNRILRPFGLKLSVTMIQKKPSRTAA
jgi:DNA-binding phage protein